MSYLDSSSLELEHPMELSPENLTTVEVYRNGPRYFTAKTSHENRFYELKQVLPDDSDFYTGDMAKYAPSELLKVETATLLTLSSLSPIVGDIAPKVVKYGSSPLPWTIREYIAGVELGDTEDPFFFRIDLLGLVDPALIVDAVDSVQRATSAFPAEHPALQLERIHNPATNLIDAASDMAAARLGLGYEHIREATLKAGAKLDRVPKVLAHGEPYPPHLFLDDNRIRFIDWENARLDNPYGDHVKVWIRAYELPEWQDSYLDNLRAIETFDEALWNAAVFQDAVCLFPYLTGPHESQPERYESATNAVANLIKTHLS